MDWDESAKRFWKGKQETVVVEWTDETEAVQLQTESSVPCKTNTFKTRQEKRRKKVQMFCSKSVVFYKLIRELEKENRKRHIFFVFVFKSYANSF